MKKKTLISMMLLCTLFYSCSKKNETITTLAQLHGKRICVLTGSAGDIAAKRTYPDARFMEMITATDAALAVKTGKADAFIHNKNILLPLIEKEPGLTLLAQPVSEVALAAAFKKGNDLFLADFNAALNTLKNNGTLDRMKQKWILTKYQTVPELPDGQINPHNGTLKMGTCARAEPLTFQVNNIMTGFDVELALRIGGILGRKIEITDMTFESLIPALQSGKIDFALSNFNVTEERKHYVNFSEPYLTNELSVLVRQ